MHRCAIALCCAALAGCTPTPAPSSPERAVLDVVLAGIEAGEQGASVALAPRTATMSAEWFPDIGAEGGGPDAALWHRLAVLSAEAHEAESLALPTRAWVISPLFAEAFAAHDGTWSATVTRARLRLSGNAGLVSVSPVAFSSDGRSALVYHEYRCGSLCGRGAVTWVARLPDGRWRVRERRPLWSR